MLTLTPSLPRRHLKTTKKSAKSETLKLFFFFFLCVCVCVCVCVHWHVNGFSSKRIALKIDILQDRKIHCLQVRQCIFQPGSFTGWCSEGVKPHIDYVFNKGFACITFCDLNCKSGLFVVFCFMCLSDDLRFERFDRTVGALQISIIIVIRCSLYWNYVQRIELYCLP